ncbi:hypothetical protein [Ekhidna sp.]|uniref:hypothetical protein n=1 Tax=Ekhidna sp. TaxID=2608089 RepID=UPI003B50C808
MDRIAMIIFFILLASFLSDLISKIYITQFEENSYRISNIWYVISYFLSIWLAYQLVPQFKKWVVALLIFFIVGGVISFFFYSLNESNTFIRVYSSLTLIIIPLMIYMGLLRLPSGPLFRNPVFWIATAFFIYGCITLLKNLFTQLLVFDLKVSYEAFYAVAVVNIIANITKNVLLLYSLLLIKKEHSTGIKTSMTDD